MYNQRRAVGAWDHRHRRPDCCRGGGTTGLSFRKDRGGYVERSRVRHRDLRGWGTGHASARPVIGELRSRSRTCSGNIQAFFPNKNPLPYRDGPAICHRGNREESEQRGENQQPDEMVISVHTVEMMAGNLPNTFLLLAKTGRKRHGIYPGTNPRTPFHMFEKPWEMRTAGSMPRIGKIKTK